MPTPFADPVGRSSGNVGPASNARYDWVDVARAVAMVLVVFGHAERGLVASGTLQGAGIAALDKVIYSFHIPLFFLISGLLFARSIGRRPFTLSWKARTVQFARPYVFWSVVLLALLVLAANAANRPISAADALLSLLLLPVVPISIFWFLYTMLICMAVSALAIERLHWPASRLLLGSLLVHAFYLLWLSEYQSGIGLQLVRFAEHELYFAIGIYLSPYVFRDRPAPLGSLADPWRPSVLAGLACIASAAASSTLVAFNLSYHSAVGTLAALCGSSAALLACCLLFEVEKLRVPRPVMLISAETLAIFCMHVPFSSGARIAMQALGIEQPYVLLATATAAGLVGPLQMLRVIRGLGLARFVGFEGHGYAALHAVRP
jgi:fucose 4-O-acetylase-like acetyltransferase